MDITLTRISVILYLTGLNYYGLLNPFFHLISMCMCSQCDSTSLPVQRIIKKNCVLEQFKQLAPPRFWCLWEVPTARAIFAAVTSRCLLLLGVFKLF